MMKHPICSGSLAVAIVITLCSVSVAGQYDKFLHFVKHRDADGNLVVPSRQNEAQVVKASTDSMKAEVAHQKPVAPQTVSHSPVQPSSNSTTVTTADADVTDETMETEVVTQGNVVSQLDAVSDEEAISEEEIVSPERTVFQEDGVSQEDIVSHAVTHESSSQEDQQSPMLYPDAYDNTMSEMASTDALLNEETPGVMKKTSIPTELQRHAFLNTHWGMSIPEVKTKESAEIAWELDATILSAGEHRLGYHTSVEGVETAITYGFEDDHLMTTKYLFDTDADKNETQPLLNYKKIKNWIIQTYGPPQTEEKIWVNELYRYAPELWGRALMRGHLSVVDEWSVDGTSIVLLLNGGDETVGLIAEFSNMAQTPTTKLVHLFPPFLTL